MQYSRALKYWMKAAQIRAIASDDEVRSTQSDLMRIAEYYDRLAQSFDELESMVADPINLN
jgi:hypothetical protein